MYDTISTRHSAARRLILVGTVASFMAAATWSRDDSSARAQEFVGLHSPSVVRRISDLSEKLELTTNTSRILTLDKNIPRVQVNNPELLAVTPLSATQVQISAKKAGVTQVNLWDEDGNIHTVDVLIYGDARELEVALATQFPHSSIKVYRYSESLVLKGFVDRPDHVSQIIQLAEDYAPKVINNISVGGVQQILLKVRVMEISRTKLRQLGVDWAYTGGGGGFAFNSVSEILSFGDVGELITNNNDTFSFGVVNGNDAFFGFLDALQQNRIAKILAEPNLVAVSGRPAQFNVGGEFPILVPQSLGTTSIEFKKFGTQVDFLPIVLGNGNIRLEVRPRVSEVDAARSVELNGFDIPALTVREIDTAVEMKAGQTFALAGLVQERTESVNRGLPYLSDMPVIGVPFRKTREEVNEIELLIMVTPEFVDAIDPSEAPCGGPGYATTSPDNCDLYCGGHLEVPAHCNPIRGMTSCGECSGCDACGTPNGGTTEISDGMILPGGAGYENGSQGPMEMVVPSEELPTMRNGTSVPGGSPTPADAGANRPAVPRNLWRVSQPRSTSAQTTPRPYSPPREPTYTRNTSRPNNPNIGEGNTASASSSGLIGPVGYDAQ